MKRGLVLEGGGVKGSYQIGAYYAFLTCRIKIDGFVGASIGSFNAEMLAEGRHAELLEFWSKINPGYMLDFNKNYVDAKQVNEHSIRSLLGLFDTAGRIIKNHGIDNTKLMNEVSKLVSYDNLKKSKKDFGLTTVQVSRKGVKPFYIHKGDIHSQEELVEYLMASSYLPVFREKRMIDNKYYIDGGFYDKSPTKILADLGYDEAYVINIKGIGLNRKVPRGIKVINIKPSRENGKILELNTSVIRDNIKMGYYDTLRVLKGLDGYKYCFKKRSLRYCEFISRKVPKKLKKRVMEFFNADNIKEAIIRALEYVMEKDHIDYYDVYNQTKMIKKYKKKEKEHFVYEFIRELKFILPF